MKNSLKTIGLVSLITWGVSILIDFYIQVKNVGGLGTYLFKTKEQINLMPYPFLIILVDAVAVAIMFLISNAGEKSKYEINKSHPISLSKDKLKALYPPVPKELVSKEPVNLTVGTIGRFSKKYVNIPLGNKPIEMISVFGSPGTAKTTTLLNFNIDNFNYSNVKNPMFVVDCKPEISFKSCIENRPDIRIINPTTTKSEWGFDPFYGIDASTSDDDIKTRASQIAHSLIPNLSADNEHFSTNAQNILVGFICAGIIKGKTLPDIVSQILSARTQDLIVEMITDSELKSHWKIINIFKQYEDNASDEFLSIQDTLKKDLSIFETDSVRYCLAGNKKKVVPNDLLEGNSIFLAIPDSLLEDYRFILGMIIEICFKYLMRQDEESVKNKNTIVFVLDEAGTIYVHSLIDVLSRGRSKNIATVIIAQSLNQLENLYGKNNARTIIDTCKIQIIYSCYDVDVASQFSRRTGTYRETKTSTNRNKLTGINGTNMENVSVEYRQSYDVSDINQLEINEKVLVFYKGLYFAVDKCPYFKIPKYLEKSNQIIEANKKIHEEIE